MLERFTNPRTAILWVPTTNGIARFDGRRFVVYDVSNTPAMTRTGSNCLVIAENRSGTIWIGTGNGLLKLVGGIFVEEPSLHGQRVEALMVDSRDRLWVGTQESGLFRETETGFDRLKLPQGYTKYDKFRSIIQRNENSVLALGTSILEYNIDTSMGDAIISFPDASGYCMLKSGDGRIWIGTSQHGLFELIDDGSLIEHSIENRYVNEVQFVKHLASDSEGNIYACPSESRDIRPPLSSRFGCVDRPSFRIWRSYMYAE